MLFDIKDDKKWIYNCDDQLFIDEDDNEVRSSTYGECVINLSDDDFDKIKSGKCIWANVLNEYSVLIKYCKSSSTKDKPKLIQ